VAPNTSQNVNNNALAVSSTRTGDACRTRSLLILPTLGSNRVYSIDTATDPRAPRLSKTVENADIASNTGLAYLHTSHCLGSGDIMISAMGDLSGNGRGNFLILGPDMKIKGTWADEDTPFG
jgi:methanethiol oxidase